MKNVANKIKIISIAVVMCIVGKTNAQFKKGAFFGYLAAGVNFCQIDGDGASGYNKFGYSVGYWVGQGLKKNWAYETGVLYSVRGARRPFNEDEPALQSFNFTYSMLDIPFYLTKYFRKFSAGGGIRTYYLIKAKDKDGFVPKLNDNMRKYGVLGVAHFTYKIGDRIRAIAEYQYSINSIRNNENNSNIIFPTGVYHNVISLGLRYNFSNENE